MQVFNDQLKALWEKDCRDPWVDGNELVFRCLFGQFYEAEPYLYVVEDEAFARRIRKETSNEIIFMILGGYNAEGSSEGFEE